MTDEDKPEPIPHSLISSTALDSPSFDSPLTTKELAEGLQQIGRATDALVRRVAGGGRDPSEHLLDQERAFHQEETGDGLQRNVQCDRCGLKSPGAASERGAIELALRAGWHVSDDADHCPTCKDSARILRGNTSPAANDAEELPAELSILDQIFLTRLEWLQGRIHSGATPVATILNARRSGHRSMLSDLARGFGYDAGAFLEKADLLVRPITGGDWAGGGSDAALFIEKLFRLLLVEDDA